MNYTRWALVIIAGILLTCSSNINWGAEHWRTVLAVDARGYYAYLPALVLQGDANFGSFEKNELELTQDSAMVYDYRYLHNGRYANKYYVGTALMELPLFLVAHTYALVSGAPSDGWSKPYVVAVNLSAILFTLLGLWCTARLLATYGIADPSVAFVLVAFTFGSNLFYYTVVAPGMSHAFSFGLCSAFLMTGRSFILRPMPKHMLWLGTLLGLIVLIRPVNGLIALALPILFDNGQQARVLWQTLRKGAFFLVGGALICLAIVGLQLVYYKAATGDWIIYSYGAEGFNWTDPHMPDMLWSYRKGLFIYTPMTCIALLGLRWLWRRTRIGAMAWVGFFTLLTYVLSCWWNWWYGGSFGSRVYVEYLAIFVLPFALALHHLTGAWKRAFMTTAILLILICQVQTYQARYYQIHWSDMDGERYWDVFLRVDRLPR